MTDIDFLAPLRDAGALFAEEHSDLTTQLVSGLPADNLGVLHFGDSNHEYETAGESTVLFYLSGQTQIEITGEDRASFVHNFCTNDIQKLQPGESCEAFITNVKGRVLGHIFIFAGTDSLRLITVPGQAQQLLAHLDRYIITEDVTLTDRTAETFFLYASGPNSTDQMQSCHLSISEMTAGSHGNYGTETFVGRVDWLNEPGYLIGIPAKRFAGLWPRLIDAGFRPAGSAAFHRLRIEAGFPWYGVDIDAENLPQEVARTEKTISFTKGCYLGQEPIARLDAMGHVNRELCTLELLESGFAVAGSVIHSMDDEREIGRITSTARTTVDSPCVSLAYLRTSHLKPDAIFSVEIEGQRVSARQLLRG